MQTNETNRLQSKVGAPSLPRPFGSALNPRLRFHCAVIEGVFQPDADGRLGFREAVGLTRERMAKVQEQVRRGVLRAFVQRGPIEPEAAPKMRCWDAGGGFSVHASTRTWHSTPRQPNPGSARHAEGFAQLAKETPHRSPRRPSLRRLRQPPEVKSAPRTGPPEPPPNLDRCPPQDYAAVEFPTLPSTPSQEEYRVLHHSACVRSSRRSHCDIESFCRSRLLLLGRRPGRHKCP
jgi:hypothetical protein